MLRFAARSKAARVALFYDMTVFHIHHSAGGFTRYFNFVGDDHLGNIRFANSRMMLTICAVISGSKRCRFIEQQYLRFHHQRTGNSNTLLLTTRKMQRVTIAIRFETQTFQQFFCTGQRLIFAQPQYTAGRSIRFCCTVRCVSTGCIAETPCQRYDANRESLCQRVFW